MLDEELLINFTSGNVRQKDKRKMEFLVAI